MPEPARSKTESTYEDEVVRLSMRLAKLLGEEQLAGTRNPVILGAQLAMLITFLQGDDAEPEPSFDPLIHEAEKMLGGLRHASQFMWRPM